MRFTDITEAAADPLPKKFWLVFDIPCGIYGHNETKVERLKDIAKGELRGVRGISDSRQIMTGWFMMGRNAAVLMDPHQVAELNDIEKVHYDDPNWLCQNNFAALYRIWDKEGSFKWRHEGMMMNLAQYTIAAMKNVDSQAASMMEYYGYATKFAYEWQEHWESEKVNSAYDAAVLFTKYLERIALKVNSFSAIDDFKRIDWVTAVREGLKKVGRTYEDEAEWIVTSPSFKIPKGSMLLVGINPKVAEMYDEWQKSKDEFRWTSAKYSLEAYEELMHAVKDNRLSDHYDVRLVDAHKFEKLRPEVMTRRRNNR